MLTAALALQSLRDAAGDELLGNYGVPIVENTEIADYNYFSYVVPVDAVPSCVSTPFVALLVHTESSFLQDFHERQRGRIQGGCE